MADKKILTQMLEHLVNDEQDKAEELFHEYVVAKSREIYEELIESELEEESKDEEVEEATKESDEDEVEEATEESDEDAVEEATEEDSDEEVEENLEDLAVEGDDDMEMGGDPTDELEAELDAEEGEDEEEKDEEALFQDLEEIVDELQAKFDELKGQEAGEEEAEMGDEEEKEEMFAPESAEEELETVREYVEKAPAPVTSEQGADTKSTVAGKNDMGGTSANIAKGADEKGRPAPTAKEHNAGNVNVPGAKNATKMTNEKGAGKETAADNKDSLFRG